jgi:hypothetical protein
VSQPDMPCILSIGVFSKSWFTDRAGNTRGMIPIVALSGGFRMSAFLPLWEPGGHDQFMSTRREPSAF